MKKIKNGRKFLIVGLILKKIKKNDKWLDTIRGKQIIYTTNDINKYTRYEKK